MQAGFEAMATPAKSAFDIQCGGSHYKDMAIQPIEFIMANGLGFCEGNAVKYVTRWKSKGGIEDLKKAIHYLQMLIEQEELNASTQRGPGYVL